MVDEPLGSSGSEGGEAGSPRGQSRMGSMSEEASFVEWLGRYSIGRIGPADETPLPPPSILSILKEKDPSSWSSSSGSSSSNTRPSTIDSSSTTASATLPSQSLKPRRGPISLSITLSQGSSQASSAASNSSASTQSFANPAVSDDAAAALLDHFRQHGTFQPPRGPYEEERLRLAHKYGLDQPVRRKAIDRICAIAKAHFKTKMVVVSLTLDDHQFLGAERGFNPNGEPPLDEPLTRLDVEPAFCTHALASSYRDPRGVFIVADANKDWRFSRNPYATRNGGGVAFYAAANVNLPVGNDADKRGLPSTLASGALCLMDGKKTLRDPSDFSEEDRAVLSDLAEMIAREFQLGFEQKRREQEAKQSEFLGSFLQQALVQPAQPGCLRSASSSPSSRKASLRTTPLNSLDQEEGGPKSTIRPDEPFRFFSNPPTPHLASDFPAPPPPAPDISSSPRPSTSHANSRNGTKQAENGSKFPPSLFTTAASNLVTLTRSQSCGILDLRSFRSIHYQPQPSVLHAHPSLSPTQTAHSASPFPSPSDLRTPSTPTKTDGTNVSSPRVARKRTESYGIGPGSVEPRSKIGLMASEGNFDWRSVVKKSAQKERRRSERVEMGHERSAAEEEGEDALALAVEETLETFAAMSTEGVDLHGLEEAFTAFAILPESTTDTCCVPIFDVDGAPALLIVLSSTEKWFSFEKSDRRFVQSVGAVLVGSLLRERARESDRAKLAFISQVSHEVRTPLYGVSSQLSLIREFSSPNELRKLAPLLDVAEICVDSLSSVLEDTLDFSKLSNSSVQEEASLHSRRLAQVDLVDLIEGVIKSTWVKKRRGDLVAVDLGGVLQSKPMEEKEKLDLILEVEDKEDGWLVSIDAGGLRRILLNLVGNALKFTKAGHVKVTLRFLGRTAPTTPDLTTPRPQRANLDQSSYRGYVAIVVEDTGIGMSQEFLRDGGLFTPFKQADSFAPGVGLGLSICDNLVKRLGPGRIDVSSELGSGTEISVTLPIDFLGPRQSAHSFPFNFAPSNRGRSSSRRNISQELEALFSEPSKVFAPNPKPSGASSTTSEPSSAAPAVPEVDFPSAVAALQASLSPSPAVASDMGPDELAVEAAKLAIATSREIETLVIPMSSPSTDDETNGLHPQHGPEKSESPGLTAKPAVKAVEKKVEQQRKASIAPDVHILFADDNPVARNILIKLFTGKGVSFSAAEDGQQAVDLFEAAQGSVSMALLDVQMPNLDGIGAAHAIREIEAERGWERSRIIALTGLSNESDMAEAMEGGVDKWLIKGGKSLRAILDEVVELQKEVEERLAADS